MAYRPSSASASEGEDDRPARTGLPFGALRPATAAPVAPPQPADADERFKQLLTEYQKLKSNNAVLKKAVLQEQDRSASLEQAVKEKEQRSRQSMEENDLLQFNNERLEKRVAILLKEIDELVHSAMCMIVGSPLCRSARRIRPEDGSQVRVS
jgi:hypothetical protein